MVEHDAATELFNATAAMADKCGLLSGEHFSVGGTPIPVWASQKSMRRKDRCNEGRRKQRHPRVHSYPESRLCRKSAAALALPSYLGHVLSDNRHSLVVNVQAGASGGTAERGVAAQILAVVAMPASA